MAALIEFFGVYISDTSISIDKKINWAILAILFALLLDNSYGFSFYWANSLKMEYFSNLINTRSRYSSNNNVANYLDVKIEEALNRRGVIERFCYPKLDATPEVAIKKYDEMVSHGRQLRGVNVDLFFLVFNGMGMGCMICGFIITGFFIFGRLSFSNVDKLARPILFLILLFNLSTYLNNHFLAITTEDNIYQIYFRQGMINILSLVLFYYWLKNKLEKEMKRQSETSNNIVESSEKVEGNDNQITSE